VFIHIARAAWASKTVDCARERPRSPIAIANVGLAAGAGLIYVNVDFNESSQATELKGENL